MINKSEDISELSELQLELLQTVFDYFKKHGRWPKSPSLHVDFRKRGDLWEVGSEINWQLLRIGEKYQEDSEVKLSIEGISLCENSEEILDLFVKVVKTCVSFYIRNPENLQVTFEELSSLMDYDSRQRAVACMLLSEAPGLLASYSGRQNGTVTNFKLSPDIVKYEQIETIDDYLSILRSERKTTNQLNAGLKDVLHSLSLQPTTEFSEELICTITDIIADEKLRSVILQDLEEIRLALSKRMWKSVTILCGSVCEGLLLSELGLLAPRTADADERVDSYQGLKSLIKQAIDRDIIPRRVAGLADFIRDARNIIHPTKAMKNGIGDRNTATASYALLGIICQSVQERRSD